jgi:predicted Zn-dependent peptidase
VSSLGAITFEDLLRFRARVFRPDRAVLVLHGDLGLEQAKRMVLLSLGSWTAQQAPPEQVAPAPGAAMAKPAAPAENWIQIAMAGPEIRVQAVAPQPGDLSPEVIQLLGLLLPGDANLAPVRVDLGDGYLVATLDGQGSSVWSLVQARLEGLRKRGFTQSDLDRARVAWLARRSLDSLHPETQLDTALAEAMGTTATEDRMKAMTLDALNAGLRRWLDPAIFRVGVAGDPEQLKGLVKP